MTPRSMRPATFWRATDPQISRYTPKHEVKRILISRAGTVENCPTTTQATTANGGGCERNNPLPKRSTPSRKWIAGL
jgi:hypothetical protein